MNQERMRAVVIASHGAAEALEVREVARPPEPRGDRVRVRVRAAGLNRADILQRMGRYPAPPGVVQDIPGLEFAGEVERVGEEVRAWRVGQRVFGITAGGAQAEYIVVPQGTLSEIPPNLDWAQAAAVPEVFITAHDALFTQAHVEMGESVLIHAAGSGVGTAAVQLVRAAGAIPYGTSRTPEKLDRAREYGLEDGVATGETPALFAQTVREWTKGRGVEVILDLVGGAYLAANLEALAQGGRLLFVGMTGGAHAQLDFGAVMYKRLTIRGTVLRPRTTEEKALATARFAAHVVPLLLRGSLRPVIDQTYAIDEVRAAHGRLESNASFGKVVLLI